jgi:transposase
MCRGIKVSAVAAVALDGLVSVQCSRDSINEDVFCEFLERYLLPHLLPFNGVNPRSVVILDNASIHHTARPVELIQSVGALVHYLPAYSPDLNPIEEMFSKVKACLQENDAAIQKVDERGVIDFVDAAFSTVCKTIYLDGMNMLDTLTRNKMYIDIHVCTMSY